MEELLVRTKGSYKRFSKGCYWFMAIMTGQALAWHISLSDLGEALLIMCYLTKKVILLVSIIFHIFSVTNQITEFPNANSFFYSENSKSQSYTLEKLTHSTGRMDGEKRSGRQIKRLAR